MAFSKCLSIFFGLLNSIIAISVLALGVWLRFFPDPIVSLFGLENVHILGLVLIGFGILFLFTMLLGCCSCCTKQRCALVMFVILLVLHTAAFFGAGGALQHYKVSVANFTVETIDNTIKTDYGFEKQVTKSLDDLQIDLACCGGSSFNVYKGSRWAEEISPLVPREGIVPPSCCIRSESGAIIDEKACLIGDLENPNGLHQVGCFTAMRYKIMNLLDVSAIALLSFGGWLLIVSLVACCMCCSMCGSSDMYL